MLGWICPRPIQYTGSLVPKRVCPQTASESVQPFMHSPTCAQHLNTHRLHSLYTDRYEGKLGKAAPVLSVRTRSGPEVVRDRRVGSSLTLVRQIPSPLLPSLSLSTSLSTSLPFPSPSLALLLPFSFFFPFPPPLFHVH